MPLSNIVLPYGPLDAPILWVGEAPGYHEATISHQPFTGPSGNLARRHLRQVGINDIEQVRWANAIRINPGTFPDAAIGAELMMGWAPLLDDDIREWGQASSVHEHRVIVACGGKALLRLTGHTSIDAWRGSVLRNADISEYLVFHQTKQRTIGYPSCLPPNVCIVPTLHPAGIMRDPSRKDLLLFRRDMQKVAAILHGRLRSIDFKMHFYIERGAIEGLYEEAVKCA